MYEKYLVGTALDMSESVGPTAGITTASLCLVYKHLQYATNNSGAIRTWGHTIIVHRILNAFAFACCVLTRVCHI